MNRRAEARTDGSQGCNMLRVWRLRAGVSTAHMREAFTNISGHACPQVRIPDRRPEPEAEGRIAAVEQGDLRHHRRASAPQPLVQSDPERFVDVGAFWYQAPNAWFTMSDCDIVRTLWLFENAISASPGTHSSTTPRRKHQSFRTSRPVPSNIKFLDFNDIIQLWWVPGYNC